MFVFSFYIFSSFLSFFDFKKFLVPNNLVYSMTLMMLVFGAIEGRVALSSIATTFFVLAFFCFLLLLNRSLIIGGGDIKYMMLVALYLDFMNFALFLIISGLLQTLALLYIQKVKKRKIFAMVPLMFLAVVLTEVFVYLHWYPFRF